MPKSYTPVDLERALAAVKEGMSYSEAKRQFGVPVTTICDHFKGRSTLGTKAGRKNSIPYYVEDKIVSSIFKSAAAGFPMTKVQVLNKVGRLVHKLKLKTQFKDGIPGDRYWRCLKQRFPDLAIRTPEACSHKRLTALSKERVGSYFEDLHTFMRAKNFQPAAIWNMDETGLQFCHKTSKVVAKKGTKRLYQRCSDSRENSTIIASINAAGKVMPPMVIVKGKTKESVTSFDTYLGPPDAFWTQQDKGWTDNTLGMEWFMDIFLVNCGPIRPQLLLLDSHCSHEVLELLELAVEQDIHIFALPPHTTQRLQPLDTNVFKPFKAAYSQACTDFLASNPSRVIDKHSFPLMLAKAWEVLKRPELLKKAFMSTGIYPMNPAAISDDSFLPSIILSRPLAENSDDLVASPSSSVAAPQHGTSAGPDDLFASASSSVSQTMDYSGLPTVTIDLNEAGPSSLLADWNLAVDSIFSVPTPEPRIATTPKRFSTSHRLLTSDEVMGEKRRKKNEKERKAAELQEKKRIREEKRKSNLQKGPQPKKSKSGPVDQAQTASCQE